MTMRKKIMLPESFDESLRELQKQNRAQMAFLSEVQKLSEQVYMDMICGSWIAAGGLYSLLVRRCSMGYTIMVCDTSRCYKTIVREMLATLHGGRLRVEADGRNEEIEITFDGNGMLHCGPYGAFSMEESLLHEEMQNEIDFALRSTYSENGDENE